MLEAAYERCCGCAACANACTENAINLEADEEGFLFPRINDDICIHCGKCEKACPIISARKRGKNLGNIAFACYSKEIDKRMQSASGAVFTVLAEKVIEQGGSVYGAALTKGMLVRHCAVYDMEALELLKGSKYVQSEIGKSFIAVKSDLIAHKMVLFSGTPCEIAGLRCFLGKDYPNLLCVDVFCHGAASPAVWQQYLHDKFKGETVIHVRFRNKTKGMKNKFLTYTMGNGQELIENYDESPYMTGYTQNLFLRRSCYTCPFKGDNRYSDLSIGDFWGLQKVLPAFGDDYGVSAVIVHTKRGEDAFRTIEEGMVWVEVDPGKAVSSNESYLKPAKHNNKREVFFNRIRNENVVDVLTELYDPHFWDYLWQDEKAPLHRRFLLKLRNLIGQ